MFKNQRSFYHLLSSKAQRSLLQISKTAKPTPISLENLLKVNPNWIQKELPFRYMHLIKFLSMRSSKVEPLLDRYLKDVDLLANTEILDFSDSKKGHHGSFSPSSVGTAATTPSTINHPAPAISSTTATLTESRNESVKVLDLTRLKQRNVKSLSLLKSLDLDKETTEQILTLNYGVEILLDEYIALVAKKQNLVEKVNVTDVANEAVKLVLEKYQQKPEINIINTCRSPITTLYIKSHLRYMLQELVQSSINCAYQPHDENYIPKLSLIIACGKEDISFRIQEEIPSISAPFPPLSKAKKKKLKMSAMPTVSLAKLIAKYWGGDIETVRSGHSYSSYMHLSLRDCGERIPPVLDTMPTDLLNLILGQSFQDRRLATSKTSLSKR